MNKNKIQCCETELLEIELSEKELNNMAKLLEVEPNEFMTTRELPMISFEANSLKNRRIVFFTKKRLTS